jgi:hypothetical protein
MQKCQYEVDPEMLRIAHCNCGDAGDPNCDLGHFLVDIDSSLAIAGQAQNLPCGRAPKVCRPYW